MRAGPRRHHVTIEEPILSEGPSGDVVTTGWRIVTKRWASIEQLQGSEVFDADAKQLDLSHRIKMPWVAGLNSNMRVEYRKRHFEIFNIDDMGERRKEHWLVCREVA